MRKTEEELQAILEAKEKKLRLKAQRQAQQAQNVQRKQEQREAHRSGQGWARRGWGIPGVGSHVDPHPLLQEEEPGGHEEGTGRGW